MFMKMFLWVWVLWSVYYGWYAFPNWKRGNISINGACGWYVKTTGHYKGTLWSRNKIQYNFSLLHPFLKKQFLHTRFQFGILCYILTKHICIFGKNSVMNSALSWSQRYNVEMGLDSWCRLSGWKWFICEPEMISVLKFLM